MYWTCAEKDVAGRSEKRAVDFNAESDDCTAGSKFTGELRMRRTAMLKSREILGGPAVSPVLDPILFLHQGLPFTRHLF